MVKTRKRGSRRKRKAERHSSSLILKFPRRFHCSAQRLWEVADDLGWDVVAVDAAVIACEDLHGRRARAAIATPSSATPSRIAPNAYLSLGAVVCAIPPAP
jgi:hypothetical protein